MAEAVQFKVCGLTLAADAELAASLGAAYLGFIFHSSSPRKITLAQYRALAAGLPPVTRVAVTVEPSAEDIAALRDAGFGLLQVHFRHDAPLERVRAWSEAAGREHLWLAPKLPPEADVPEAWLPFAGAFLLDTFQSEVFGGTGKTGDWSKFARHKRRFPGMSWILAGGLEAGNIGDALRESGAWTVDVNSRVESSPGIKDAAKLKAFVEALRRPGAE